MIVEGNIAFSNVTEHDTFQGQSTGRYSVTVTLDDAMADKLQSQGVKIKTYVPKDEEGNPLDPMLQRKFASKYGIKVVDSDDEPWGREIPRGSKVRIKYALGNEHPVHGVSTYVNAVRILELAEDTMGEGGDEEDKDF